jgi:aminoglycoside 6'-N-acetyltransferase
LTQPAFEYNQGKPFAQENPMLTLFSSRLCLRPLESQDLAAFCAYRSDPEVARYQGWDAPYALERATALLEEMQRHAPGTPGHWTQMAVERLGQPGLIGDCAFHVQADDHQQALVGYTFAREFQGQGFASEAVTRLLGFLFDDLNLHRVSAYCDVNNLPSARLLERVGMRLEGHFVENIWFKGAWCSEFQYAILKSEWRQRQ